MPRTRSQSVPAHEAAGGEALAASYGSLFQRLLPGLTASLLLDREQRFLGSAGPMAAQRGVVEWIASLGWTRKRGAVAPAAREIGGGTSLVAIPFADSHGQFIGAACVQLSAAQVSRQKPESAVREALGPALECLHREFLRLRDAGGSDEATVERTQDLEWLFNITGDLKRDRGDAHLLRKLLAAACQRMDSALGLVSIPEKQMSIVHAAEDVRALRESAGRAEPHLLAWAARRGEVLMVNEPPRPPSPVPPVKFLSVPIQATAGRVLGILAFFRAPDAPGFTERQQYLAGHLANQVIQHVDSQFDLMTGLPTRGALEQSFESLCLQNPGATRSIVYLDIDELHVCNETHGFEIGDELIVRVAQVLSSGVVPDASMVARISADSFAMILDDTDPRDAAVFAGRVQELVRAIRIGPDNEPVKVSVSCGVSVIVDMPKGFARALAAAELACKTAKDRGRDRVEVYACEDSSMMRRHDDVIVVGQLRDAIRTERLVLFAQPIVSLANDRRVSGFEVLLRMREEDGTLTPPGKFMSAAQRYQLLPQIDRYVLRRTLELAIPFRGLLREMKATLSINVSGQSVGDDSFVDYMLKAIRESQIAPGMITCEITEQTAVSSLAKAAQTMSRLRQAGCGVALDDFGVGANTFAYLKGLPATRIKIDGSFVRDMLTNRRSAAMVQSLVALAKEFGMETVGEYVESEELAVALAAIGVENGQGYHFGKPADMETVLRGLRDDESRRMRALWLET